MFQGSASLSKVHHEVQVGVRSYRDVTVTWLCSIHSSFRVDL